MGPVPHAKEHILLQYRTDHWYIQLIHTTQMHLFSHLLGMIVVTCLQ